MAISSAQLGKRLKAARKGKYTQERLAEALGLSIAYISRVECGHNSINLDKLDEWCDLLEIPIAEIVGGADMASGGSQRFREIAKDCSPETVEMLLDICEQVVQSIDREARRRCEG